MDTSGVRAARPTDFEPWIALARTLEPLFGPMADVPEFRAGLAAALTDGTAFTAEASDRFAGGIVVHPAANAIAWLAVAPESRGLGLGGALLRIALARLDPGKPVAVQTFAPDCAAGGPARTLYRRQGFVDKNPAEPTPAGIPTVLMVRDPIEECRSGAV